MDDLSRDDLKRLLKERDAFIAVQQEQLQQQQLLIQQQQEQLESLASELKLLKRALFGHRRERFDSPDQLTLFDSQWVGSSEEEDEPVAEDSTTATESPPRQRGKRGRIVIPEAMPRKEVVHPLRDEDLPESLRGREDLRRFRKKVGQYIELVESSAYVVEEYVEVLAADNDDATETEMVTAPRPPRILNSYAGPSLLASLVVDRFADYLPYYRLEERLDRLGLKIARSTISRWMIQLSQAVLPLVDLMRREAKLSQVICVDETPVKLLKAGLSKAATSYLWTVVGDASHPYNVYYFTEDRSRAGPEQFLADYAGILVSDAYVCYESLQSEWRDHMKWACCHAHARRKFESVHFLGATRQTKTAMAYYRLLFDIEDEARTMSSVERHTLRQREARPVLEKFKTWMDERLQTLRPKHPLREPIQYMTKRWPSFERYLESGDVPIENNAAERSVKLPVIAKKNHLFFASPGGGEAAMVFYSLTSTCRRLHVDPAAYLHDVFKRLPITPEEQLQTLLPDRWIADHPDARLQLRADEADQRAKSTQRRRSQRRKELKKMLKG